MKNNIPSFLTIGHICKDLTKSSYSIGGTAFFAALAAKNMRLTPSVITKTDPVIASKLSDLNIQCLNIPTKTPTIFHNQDKKDKRVQHLLQAATKIPATILPKDWKTTPIVLLSPIINEVGFNFFNAFAKTSLLGACLQGWIRKPIKKLIHYKNVPTDKRILRATVLFASKEDFQNNEEEFWKLQNKILILTNGPNGCTIKTKNTFTRIPSIKIKPVNTIGAGDIFAASFLIHYFASHNPIEAALFANISAAKAISAKTIFEMPKLKEISKSFNKNKKIFLDDLKT